MPSRERPIAASSNASVTRATDAWSISRSVEATSGAMSASSAADAHAGHASTAASASIRYRFGADVAAEICTVPSASSSIDSTVVDSATVVFRVSFAERRGDALDQRRPSRLRGAKKTGAVGSGGCARRSARSPNSSDRDLAATAATCGDTASALRRSASPALMPPISGSTSRSSTSRPNRLSTSGPSASGGTRPARQHRLDRRPRHPSRR